MTKKFPKKISVCTGAGIKFLSDKFISVELSTECVCLGKKRVCSVTHRKCDITMYERKDMMKKITVGGK